VRGEPAQTPLVLEFVTAALTIGPIPGGVWLYSLFFSNTATLSEDLCATSIMVNRPVF
jgi:hypothetical protein